MYYIFFIIYINIFRNKLTSHKNRNTQFFPIYRMFALFLYSIFLENGKQEEKKNGREQICTIYHDQHSMYDNFLFLQYFHEIVTFNFFYIELFFFFFLSCESVYQDGFSIL